MLGDFPELVAAETGAFTASQGQSPMGQENRGSGLPPHCRGFLMMADAYCRLGRWCFHYFHFTKEETELERVTQQARARAGIQTYVA